jgi:hypothetical protein
MPDAGKVTLRLRRTCWNAKHTTCSDGHHGLLLSVIFPKLMRVASVGRNFQGLVVGDFLLERRGICWLLGITDFLSLKNYQFVWKLNKKEFEWPDPTRRNLQKCGPNPRVDSTRVQPCGHKLLCFANMNRPLAVHLVITVIFLESSHMSKTLITIYFIDKKPWQIDRGTKYET